ncbi:hypothetical protein [Alistipes shahii]
MKYEKLRIKNRNHPVRIAAPSVRRDSLPAFPPMISLVFSLEEGTEEGHEAKISGEPILSAGKRPAERTILPQFASESTLFPQAYGLHDRTAKSAEKVSSTARAPGAGVQTTATGEGRDRFAGYAEPPQSKRRVFLRRKSSVFRARSASDGDDTRDFSLCLTFGYFWVKPKVQRKNVAGFSLQKVAALQRRAGRSLRPRRPATKACAPQTSTRISCKKNLSPLFLSKKEPKKTARRKWSGSRRTPR